MTSIGCQHKLLQLLEQQLQQQLLLQLKQNSTTSIRGTNLDQSSLSGVVYNINVRINLQQLM